jgi:tetratricopeptide (TPR) repeat protein
MRLLTRISLLAAITAVISVVMPADSGGGAGLRSIRGHFNRKEYSRAEATLEEELPGMRGRTRDQARLLLANLQTDIDEAGDLLDTVIRTGDSREALKARLELAKIHYSAGEYHQAVRTLEGIRAEGRGGTKYEAVYFRGLSRKQLGDLEGARRDFERIDRGDYLHWSYIALAEIDIRSGRIAEAVERYETIAADHSSPIAGFRLGECYELTGEREKALRTYRNVARNFPGSPEAPKAREKVQMIDSSLERAARPSTVGGGEEGEASRTGEEAVTNGSPMYTLQFGAFSEKKNAQAFISDLESLIDGLHIEAAESGGKLWYRVRAGRYASREEAEEAALKVMERTGYSSKVLPAE